MPSGINVMISLRSDVSERPHRFHPNDTQLQLPDSQSIKGRFSEYETAVRSCKHCSFSFRTDLNDTKTDEYCSKDCRVCHTWFTGSSHSQKSSDFSTCSRSSSPRVKSQQKYSPTHNMTDIYNNQNYYNNRCHINSNTKVRNYLERKKEYQSKSDKIESYGTTWRVCNPKGEKTILSSNSSKIGRIDNYNISSPPSVTEEVVASPVSSRQNFHRVLSYFYQFNSC